MYWHIDTTLVSMLTKLKNSKYVTKKKEIIKWEHYLRTTYLD